MPSWSAGHVILPDLGQGDVSRVVELPFQERRMWETPIDVKYPRLCSRWTRCSVNKCPLDPHNDQRESIPGDPERKCREHPARRHDVAALAKAEGNLIPGGGLTEEERASGKTLEAIVSEWEVRKWKNSQRRKEHIERVNQARKRGHVNCETTVSGLMEPESDGSEVVEQSIHRNGKGDR